jgi:hypothetical protein
MIFVVDIVHIVVIETISVLAIIANILCAYIFSNGQFDGPIFKYLTTNSIVDCLLVLSWIVVPFINSSAVQLSNYSYYMNAYKLFVIFYVSRVLSLLSTLLNIKVAFDRIVLIRTKKNPKGTNQKFKTNVSIVFMILFSCCALLPKMFFMQIDKIVANNTNMSNYSLHNMPIKYKITISNESKMGKFSHYLSNYLTTIPVCCTLTLMNTILIVSICRKRYNSNSDLLDRRTVVRRKATRNTILCMVIWLSSINTAIQIITLVVGLFFILEKGRSLYSYREFLFFLSFINVSCHGGNIIIYYFYNRQFAICLKRIFKLF